MISQPAGHGCQPQKGIRIKAGANALPSIILGFCLTVFLAFCIRMLEWPVWQNPEYSFDNEMLLATHDAYHWVAGACGFGAAAGHPMAELLRLMAHAVGLPAVVVAFWFPPLLASLVGGIVYLWAYGLGAGQAGIAAGLIATISPGFLGRTLLGFYDTDLVTLFFPLAIALAPAIWICRHSGQWPEFMIPRSLRANAQPPAESPVSLFWLLAFAASGLLACYAQQWHSVFPYLVRFNVIFIGLAIICFGPRGGKSALFAAGLAYAMPCAFDLAGLLFPLALICARAVKPAPKVCLNKWLLALLWLITLAWLAQGDIFDAFMRQINAYLKHSGDSHASGTASLVFPSVAQSIIEVQDLAFTALFPYFHPWLEAALPAFVCFLLVIWRRPGAAILLPLAVLGILSFRLGGRMVMFGAPIVALGLTLPIFWIAHRLIARWTGRACAAWLCACLITLIFVAPFLDMIPALSQGPALNRRHAAALAAAGGLTPKDAMLWVWWDWGYAAQYFARRQTIADGARHGGPSLYLPAAVFATDNPRFARQIIRHTSACANEPGNFFRDLNAEAAQDLLNRLRSPQTPLVPGQGRQFIIISFEMLKLGFWISNYGNWNFALKNGEGGALSIVPQAVYYRLNAGEVRLQGSPDIIFPTSINIFAETGLTKRNYVVEWFAAHPGASKAEQEAWLQSRRNVNFLFNRVTDEKLAMDMGIYDSLMVQLLLCDVNDTRFAPYFRLLYDNVFARIYEVLP